jgi:membrane protein
VIILGAEISAEIEHASPWGKAPAEKVPGQKKKLGYAAAREYRARAPQRPDASPPSSQPAPAPVYRVAQRSVIERVGAYVVLLLRWRSRAKS